VNLGLVLNKLNKVNEAYKYIQEAETLTKDDPKVNIMYKMALAENLYLKKKYKESEAIIDNLIPQIQSSDENENLVFLLLIKAQINEKKVILPQQNLWLCRPENSLQISITEKRFTITYQRSMPKPRIMMSL
jgi:hypothetical protein